MAKQDIFTLGRKPTEEDRLKGQALDIVNTIAAAGKGGLTREDLVEQLQGQLTTKQPATRVLAFYASKLRDAGLIEITKAQKAEAADGEGKAKKAKKKKAK